MLPSMATYNKCNHTIFKRNKNHSQLPKANKINQISLQGTRVPGAARFGTTPPALLKASIFSFHSSRAAVAAWRWKHSSLKLTFGTFAPENVKGPETL